MAQRDNADDAVNSAVPGIVHVCAVVDVVFGGDGCVRLGDVFHGVVVVIQDADAAEAVAPVGFKDGNVMWVGFNCAALNENEGVRVAAAVLHVDDAETFERHGVGLAFDPGCSDTIFVGNKVGQRQGNDVSAGAVNCDCSICICICI